MRSRKLGLSASLALLMAGFLCSSGASAQVDEQSRNAQAEPAMPLGLAMNLPPDRRYFFKFGGVNIKVNSKTSGAYDVTGPVFKYPEQVDQTQLAPIVKSLFLPVIFGTDASLGTPANATASVKNSRGVFGSFGYFFDENQNWAIEALLVAAPFKQVAKGTGVLQKLGDVIETRFLPPLVMGSYYFGNKADKLRLNVGVGVTYVMFFDSEAKPSLEEYVGGPTELRVANRFGYGGFIGAKYQINERWSLNASIGKLKLKTTATLTTKDTQFTSDSAVLRDYNITALNTALDSTLLKPVVDQTLNGLKNSRGGNLGTFVRKMDVTLDPVLFMLTVGYAF